MNKNFITVKTFVERVESFSIDFYKKCLLETNQFSTKYVLQNVIKEHSAHSQEVVSAAAAFRDEKVNGRHLQDIMQDFIGNHVDSEFELDNLNFVEATHLTIVLMEYVISIYQKLMAYELSKSSIETLNSIFTLKKEYLKSLTDEYEKLRYK